MTQRTPDTDWDPKAQSPGLKTGDECRARAAAVRAFATASVDIVAIAAWGVAAAQWDGLAQMADDQDALTALSPLSSSGLAEPPC